MTLADVAARCDPPTTAQTIGRLETGTRNLSLAWMNRIAAALAVDSELLVKGKADNTPAVVARLTASGAEGLDKPMDAVLPTDLMGDTRHMALLVELSTGEYRAGDQLWLRPLQPDEFLTGLNRDILVPRPSGRFAFGRMIDHRDGRVAVLPPGAGSRQIVVDQPAWIAVAAMLVRPL